MLVPAPSLMACKLPPFPHAGRCSHRICRLTCISRCSCTCLCPCCWWGAVHMLTQCGGTQAGGPAGPRQAPACFYHLPSKYWSTDVPLLRPPTHECCYCGSPGLNLRRSATQANASQLGFKGMLFSGGLWSGGGLMMEVGEVHNSAGNGCSRWRSWRPKATSSIPCQSGTRLG